MKCRIISWTFRLVRGCDACSFSPVPLWGPQGPKQSVVRAPKIPFFNAARIHEWRHYAYVMSWSRVFSKPIWPQKKYFICLMWYIILKKRFLAFLLHISFCHFCCTNLCKSKLKYDNKNEILTNFQTVKTLCKYPCISSKFTWCKEKLFSFPYMSFVLVLMFYTSQDPAIYNMNTQLQQRKVWESISLDDGLCYQTVIGQNEKQTHVIQSTSGNRWTSQSL